jgi:hypothetical protein
MILGLDPGPVQTGYCYYEAGTIFSSGVYENAKILELLHDVCPDFPVAIEMIASYGMAVGAEVFETCVWIGRFIQAHPRPKYVRLVYRKDVKLYLCDSPRAKDGNIRQALLDRIGPIGTKKAPGPCYGVKSHAWAALAVAVTASKA